MNRRPRVALLIESSRAYGRGLLRGIASFSRTHGPWEIFHHERGLADPLPGWLSHWRGDGVIARIDSRPLAEYLQRLHLPMVDMRGRFDLPGVPLFETNDREVARLAMEHLVARGFQRLAYCGFADLNFSQRRLHYFREQLAEREIELFVYEGPPGKPGSGTPAIEAAGLHDGPRIAAWLRELPKPVGLLACNDIRGRQVLAVCRELEIQVPDELALLGVDNDLVTCELAEPPLSSVEPDTVRIGYQGAACLQAMMEGRPPAEAKYFVDPLGIVARRSTEVLAISDRDIAEAVRFIREHACRGLQVADVVKRVGLSRSTLERRFHRHVHTSPKAEIIRVRLERVKQLLQETDYPLARIAEMAGFRHAEYMSTLFREKVGQTPGKYRASLAPNSATQRPIGIHPTREKP